MDKVCALHFTRTERVKSIIADGHLKPSNPHNTEAAVWAASSEITELRGSVLGALSKGQKHMNGVAKERHKNDGCTELDDVTLFVLDPRNWIKHGSGHGYVKYDRVPVAPAQGEQW